MRKWLIWIALLSMLFSPAAVEAQVGTKLQAIDIELWSEYDQPSMLVIFQFAVSQETPLPAEVMIRFPKDANLVAVAVEDNGELFNKRASEPVEQGNWQTITINAESYQPHRIEYYQPLTKDANTRQFKFHWYGDYDVEEFIVTYVIPVDSTEIVTSPPVETTSTTADGLHTVGTVTKTDLKLMNSFQFELEYQRTSTALTRSEESPSPIEPVAPVDENTAGRVSITNLPWIIGGFGLALIGIALYSYWRSTQSTEAPPRTRRRQKKDGAEGEAYCHECGARAHPGDRFCRTCGSRLRVE